MATLLSVGVGGAQSPARAGAVPGARAATPRPPASSAASSVVLPTRSEPAIVVATTATALAVVRIPVPSTFPVATRVNYTVTPLVEGALVGRLTGSFPGGGTSDRAVLFAMRSPRGARAGQVQVALTRFSTTTTAVEVPVIANVAAVRDVTIQPVSRAVTGVAGATVRLGFRISNLGNIEDTVTVTGIAPVGWRVEQPTRRPVPARQAVDGVLGITPPPQATGTATIRLVATAHGALVSEGLVDVQLPAAPATASAGPTVRLGAAAARGPWPGLASVESVELQGFLTDGIAIQARASTTPDAGLAGYAFTRASVASMPFLAQLSGSDWRLDGGTIGASVSDLAGVNLMGRGASVSARRPGWNVMAVGATPDLGWHDADGSLAATRVEVTPGVLAFSTAVSRLRETRGGTARELDAWSIGARHDGLFGGRGNAELARRRSGSETFPGWSLEWERRVPDENFSLRYLHAPGGTAAFARATDELSLDGGRRITDQLHVTAGAWRTRDEGAATLAGLDMDGWTAGGRFAISPDFAVSLTARRSAFQAAMSLGEFGSAEQGLDAQVEHRRGSLSAQVTASAARLRRSGMLDEPSSIRFTREAPRAGVRATVGALTGGAMVSLSGQFERTGAGVGASPVQWSYSAQVTGTPVPGLGGALRVDAAVERNGGSYGVPQATTLRAAADLQLPLDFTVRAGVERNAYILPEPGASPWMYVLGVTRAVRLPRLSSGDTRGLVYRDLNGNGRRDGGESGIAGVALRRGGELVVTDRQGVFLLKGQDAEPIEADARTLPPGWILPSTLLPRGTREAGAIAVSPLTITLALEATDGARVDRSELALLDVVVRDSAGRGWVARRASDSTAVFDALPPGRYHIEVDPSASREPLRPVAEVPPVTLIAGRAPAPIRIVLRARPLRFSNPRRLPAS